MIASATPTKAADTTSEVSGACIGTRPAVTSTSRTPSTSGTVTPASETAPAVPASRVTRWLVKA